MKAAAQIKRCGFHISDFKQPGGITYHQYRADIMDNYSGTGPSKHGDTRITAKIFMMAAAQREALL